MTYLVAVAASLALVRWVFPPQPQERRPAPYDRIALHHGGNPTMMLYAGGVLILCAATVAWLAMGLLWGAVGMAVVAGGYAVLVEGIGGVEK